MKKSSFSLALIALSCVCASAAPVGFDTPEASSFDRQYFKVHTVRPYQGERPMVAADPLFEGSDLQKDLENQRRELTPSKTFTQINGYDYLNGPDGSTWYYTMTTTTTFEPYYDNPPEYWDYLGDYILHSYTFTVYNQYFERVGVVSDNITLDQSNPKIQETRARDVWIDPVVTRRFFNDDDNYEVMIFHAINCTLVDIADTIERQKEGKGISMYAFANRYYQKVYSLGGEMDENTGMSKPIMQIEGRCVDATNAQAETGGEEWYLTFIEDAYPDFWTYRVSPIDNDYVENVKSLVSPLTTYKAKADGSGIEKLFTYGLGNARVPHDTTDGIYLITKVKDGKAYYIYSQYEKPYFVNPLGGALDESATPDNRFMINAYEVAGGEINHIADTYVPVAYPSIAQKLIYAFYSIGGVTYRDDVDISGALGTPQAPAYIVTEEIAEAANLDGGRRAYKVYDSDGKYRHSLALNVMGMSILGTTSDGPLALFVKRNEDTEDFYFEINSLYKNEKIATISQYNNNDPLTASVALYKKPDGDYEYGFLMSYWAATDENGNDHARVQWFKKDGNKDHIDYINLGRGVERAQVNLTNLSVDPYLYDDDAGREYAVLVSRKYGDFNREEFIIVDDSGKWFGQFSADDGKGNPRLFMIVPGFGDSPNRVMMSYDSGTVDIYDLPFSQSDLYDPAGVERIEAAENAEMSPQAGKAVYFNLQGMPVTGPRPGDILIRRAGSGSEKIKF